MLLIGSLLFKGFFSTSNSRWFNILFAGFNISRGGIAGLSPLVQGTIKNIISDTKKLNVRAFLNVNGSLSSGSKFEQVQFEYQTSAMKKPKTITGTVTSDPNTYVINITNI